MYNIDDIRNTIIQGNALEVLKNIPDNSIDACITDPPYGLSDHKPDDVVFILKEWLNGNDSLLPNKKGFMGKGWDAFVPPPAVWKEVLRVLKPGAHCLVFAGTRTVDLMGISLRLGGFEIRDEIVWCYGSGFPKSLNIGKAVDQIIGNERISIGISTNGIAGGTKELIRGNKNSVGYKKEFVITKGNSEWEGWGTALKPAIEPIIVARKPLEKGLNVAENCLKWGTGGLNIDGCRIGLMENDLYNKITSEKQGRFPSNMILDGSEEVNRLFPQNNSRFFYKAEFSEEDFVPLFYCPKVSRGERNIGTNKEDNYCVHPTVKPLKLIEYLVKLITRRNQIVLDPFIGSGTTGIACKKLGRNYIGIEINDDYIKIAEKRIAGTLVNETLFDREVL